jgi:hypothetical protein
VVEHTGDDMTAIASAFTSEGFVIGADGRQLGKDKKIFTESSQQIFNFKHRHVNVAYAWCGETSVVNESNEVLYDLYAITRVAVSSAVQAAGKQFASLIQQSCVGIYDGGHSRVTASFKRGNRTYDSRQCSPSDLSGPMHESTD